VIRAPSATRLALRAVPIVTDLLSLSPADGID
jgi:hypothetical protein